MPQSKVTQILDELKKHYPNSKCSLNYNNPLQLLIATILSAQCTDKRVNLVTKEIFKKYAEAKDYANTPVEQLEQDIKSTGFYRNKAKNIKATSQMIINDFNNQVPDTMDQLIKLPGVARKTANVVLGNWFHKNEGVVVDTHVSRITQRLNLTKNKDPNKIEKDLIEIIPKAEWTQFSHYLIDHGRKLCKAPKPNCQDCFFSEALCPSKQKFLKHN